MASQGADEDSASRHPASAPEAELVRGELAKLISDERFANSPRMIRFLNYTLGETLAGRPDQLKEILLGREVFDRGDNFDPRIDPIVRVQAGNLRAKLQDYYEHEGAADPVRVEFPKGGYVPRFIPNTACANTPLSDAAGTAAAEPTPSERRRRWKPIQVSATAVVLVMLGAAGWNWLRKAETREQDISLTQLTFEAGSAMMPAISRDGKLLAYSSDRGKGDLNIWIRPISGGGPVQLTYHEGDDHSPDFSPDGTSVVFRSHRDKGGIFVVPIFGGAERKIVGDGWQPRVSPDGAWVAYLDSGHAISVVPTAGGQPRRVTGGDIEALSGPIWTPQGTHLLFLGAPHSAPVRTREYDWYTVPWTGGTPAQAGLRQQLQSQGLPEAGGETKPGDWLGDAVVFSLRSGKAANIWKAPIHQKTLRVGSPVVQLTAGTAAETFPRCSASGQIVFTSEALLTHIFSLRLNERTGEATGAPEQVTSDSSLYYNTYPRLSADGKRLAFVSNRSGTPELLIKDLENGRETSASALARQESLPLVSGDESLLVYGSGDDGRQRIYEAGPGEAFPRRVCDRCGTVADWSRDGRTVLLEEPSRSALITWDRSSGRRMESKCPAGSLIQANLSPDQKWLALVLSSPLTGFVAPLASASLERDRLTAVAASPDLTSMHWSPDGSLLYYFALLEDYRCLWAQRLDLASRHPLGRPFAVQHFHSNRLRPWSSQISVGKGRMVFGLTEPRSNIWLGTLPGSSAPIRTALR